MPVHCLSSFASLLCNKVTMLQREDWRFGAGLLRDSMSCDKYIQKVLKTDKAALYIHMQTQTHKADTRNTHKPHLHLYMLLFTHKHTH